MGLALWKLNWHLNKECISGPRMIILTLGRFYQIESISVRIFAEPCPFILATIENGPTNAAQWIVFNGDYLDSGSIVLRLGLSVTLSQWREPRPKTVQVASSSSRTIRSRRTVCKESLRRSLIRLFAIFCKLFKDHAAYSLSILFTSHRPEPPVGKRSAADHRQDNLRDRNAEQIAVLTRTHINFSSWSVRSEQFRVWNVLLAESTRFYTVESTVTTVTYSLVSSSFS